MKRWKFCILLLFFCQILFISEIPSYAHEVREHDKYLEKVLFEDGYSTKQSDDIKNAVKALEYASYLTIDQFKGNQNETGKEKFDWLKKMKMGGLPRDFSSINYSTAIDNPDKQITANTHRMYTHQGWDRVYTLKNANKFWNKRRDVLLGTVNSVFNFSSTTIFGYDEKCNSMAGIIYYIHILGDYDEADKYTKINLLSDLAGRINANDIDKDYDIITSLESYIEILFEDQKKSSEYKELMDELDKIAEKAGKLVQSTGGVNTDEEFAEYHQYANDVLDLLIKYLPTLLKNEDFFAKKFYPDYTR